MIRYGLLCPGCDLPFIARVGTDSTAGTKFYLPCPSCRLPIRAIAQGDDLGTFGVEFVDCKRLKPDDLKGAKVVTANPFVPAKPQADFDEPTVAFSMMTLVELLGDDSVIPFMAFLGSARQTIQERWQPVRRIFEYYLDENWPVFDRSIASAFPDAGWPSGNTVHERATRAYTAMLTLTGQLVMPSDQMHRFLGRFTRKHTAVLDVRAYRARLVQDRDDGKLAELERSIFDVTDLFIQRSEMWAMGGLPRVVRDDRRELLDELVLARDEFGEVRDLYQQGFEVICKTLRYPVAAQNTLKRHDPDNFGADHPQGVPENRRPTTLKSFDRLPNAYRIAYVAQVPGWEGLTSVLDNKVRNTIGHGKARHDLRSGRVISDANPAGVTYLQFLAGVYDLFEALIVTLQVVRFARVASSPDFGH